MFVSGIPQDLYQVYMGNNALESLGTPGLRLKGVRIWLEARSLTDISIWRYRQVDPRQEISLVIYYRLDEGVQSYFNFANIAQNGTLFGVESWSGITM